MSAKSKTKNKQKILITGGHLTPALAILHELQNRGFDNFVWVGSKHTQIFGHNISPEYALIQQKKIKFYNLTAGKLWRRWVSVTFFKALVSLLLIPVGFIQAFFILLKEKPSIVLSFGGFNALPIVFMASLLRIKTVTHEQTITSGLANRLIAKFADKVLISWPHSAEFYPAHKTILTGNPIRHEVFNIETKAYTFNNSLPIIYITGGNQGANAINKRIIEVIPELLKIANIIHQTGNSTMTRDYEKALTVRENLPQKYQKRYHVYTNIFDDTIGEILNKATLIVSRAGANTVSEILALDKFALLMPIPWTSGNEQVKNAEYAQKLGNATIIKQYKEMPANELKVAIIRALTHAQSRKSVRDRNYVNPSTIIADLIQAQLL